ncbi:MAG: hypothetical protein BWY74_00334 [Firmicutes bacterium ADurb.Bin419]|nr:MAG: hypothetical protein BWY74_00334 [Firmicutes bacterium ADurb.Bin419]
MPKSKDLKDKAIQIKGKSYVQVPDRIIYFNETYQNGSIKTEIISQTDSTITIRATVTPDVDKPERIFTGTAQEWKDDPRSMVNKTSFVENAETSAVGRALAMLGIGVIDSIASVDEITIAENKNTRYNANKDLPWLNVTNFKDGSKTDKWDEIKEIAKTMTFDDLLSMAKSKYKVSKKTEDELKQIHKEATLENNDEPFDDLLEDIN